MAQSWRNSAIMKRRPPPAVRRSGCGPADANAHANLGLALRGLGQLEEAQDSLHQAIRLEPGHRNARTGLAMTLLLQGRLSEGFAAYEDRLSPRPAAIPGPPPWRGEALRGRTILLHAEQGIGDTIQFAATCRCLQSAAPDVCSSRHHRCSAGYQRGCQAWMLCSSRAAGNAGRCPLSVDEPSACLRHDARDHPGGSLPAGGPCGLARWDGDLQDSKELRVGLVWAGNPQHQNDRNRSIELSGLAPFWCLPGVHWVSLQVGARAAELEGGAPPGALLNLAPELTDLAETAAAMERLDLIVTVDTAVAHLAGALGRPVWVMLPALPDWRWLLGREDSPWYPTMRLFRQARLGERGRGGRTDRRSAGSSGR